VRMTASLTGSGPVKMPNPPAMRNAWNATVPPALSAGSKNWLNGPAVSVMAVVGPPLPVKMPSPPQSAPGSNYEYSNLGYVIAGALVEKVTGKPWQKNMVEHVFGPFGDDERRVRRDWDARQGRSAMEPYGGRSTRSSEWAEDRQPAGDGAGRMRALHDSGLVEVCGRLFARDDW
jgi:CubicO group peptidase (beta-lactamase class C family)